MKLTTKPFLVLFILTLIILLPVAHALEISNVQTIDVTQNSATITYTTDIASNTIIGIGKDKSTLINTGDAPQVTDHKFKLQNLEPSTQYFYQVGSNDQIDNNNGEYYAFTTQEPDTAPPPLTADVPDFISSTILTFSGESEPQTEITLKLNGQFIQVKQTDDQTIFTFQDIILLQDANNNITLIARDTQKNEATIQKTIYTDISTPRITLEDIPKFVGEHKITLRGNLSEMAELTAKVGNNAVQKINLNSGSNTKDSTQPSSFTNTIIPFTIDLQLQEGMNNITLTATDRANHSSEKEFKILSDTQPPQVRLDVERGKEYYEGRAESTIHGTTDPLSTVYLYIYTPQSTEYYPDFKRARAKTKANENGEFTFKDVSFSGPGFRDATLDDFSPKELPSALVREPIYPFQSSVTADSKPYHIYIIAEDVGGRTGYIKDTVQVNSCFSPNFDFSIESLPEYQAPLKLIPQLLDDGRQDIQATFKLSYLGAGVPSVKPNGDLEDRGIKVTSLEIEPACTDGMAKDEKYSLGCKILPKSQPNPKLHNTDSTVWYVGWKLLPAADFNKRDDNTWDDFKKRQLVFPLKVKIRYSEKTGENTYSEAKDQYFCTDLSYFVDIPIEAKEYIPDFLAHDTVNALNWTIERLHDATPYVEKAYLISGYTCMGSFLLKTTARFGRIFTSKIEVYYDIFKPKGDKDKANADPEKCPTSQNELYREDELQNYLKIKGNTEAWSQFQASAGTEKAKKKMGALVNAITAGPNSPEWNLLSLDKRCASTATAWTIESALDKAYKWSCDRAFCRTVPAGWTSDADLEAIEKVIQKQQECGVTGRGVTLIKRENCKELVEKSNDIGARLELLADSGTCWEAPDKTLYVNDQSDDTQEKLRAKSSFKGAIGKDIEDPSDSGVFYLRAVGGPLPDLVRRKESLLVYKPEGSDTPIVGRDRTCKNICGGNKRVQGFGPDIEHGDNNGCYDELKAEGGTVTLISPKDKKSLGLKAPGEEKAPKRYAAGYTSDCFLKKIDPTVPAGGFGPEIENVGELVVDENGEPILQQCVCIGAKPESSAHSARTAIKEFPTTPEGGSAVKEEWFYHQDQLFRENKNLGQGTYYPTIRYYTGRDISSAFGADYLLDYIHTTDNTKTEHQVNPHTQLLGTVQTVCLSGILKNMKMLEAMLTGIRNCLVEAKYTGLQDAGMCKTLFTQQVCGLLYKAIASATSGCSPSTFEDLAKETIFGDVGVFIKQGTEAMGSAVSTSIDDLQQDYGNAKLNEYFKGGVQGFAQSICLAAFGYDIPLFTDDFLLDAAYAFPVQSAVLVVPANREFSSYNPAKQTAIYNYQIGATILPGCKMAKWSVKLKCIGPEDAANVEKGIDESCDGQGCDCLNIQTASPFDNQRTLQLKSGTGAQSGSLITVPIETPVRSEGPFRYDHVVVELTLDGSEKGNEEACFDKKYIDGNKATYYFPIADHSPKILAGCSANLASGRFSCPELSNLLGFGAAYIEQPEITCWNEKTQSRMDCNTPNLYTIGDRIRVGAHLYLDGKIYCLKRTVHGVPGIPETQTRLIPSAITGPFVSEDEFPTISESYFGGTSNTIQMTSSSNTGCNRNFKQDNAAPETVTSGQYIFNYRKAQDGKLTLDIQGQSLILPSDLKLDGTRLTKITTENTFTRDELNNIIFDVSGFKVSDLFKDIDIDNTQNLAQQCILQVGKSSQYATESGKKSISIRYDLLQADDQGTCTYAKDPVKTAGMGKPTAQTSILIQKERSVSSSLHENFMSGNYNDLRNSAMRIIEQERGDTENAVAIYYYTGSLVLERGTGTEQSAHNTAIKNLLNMFFKRQWQGRKISDYPLAATQTPEFQKIAAYLCQVDKQLGGPYGNPSGNPSGNPPGTHPYCVGKI